VAELYRPPNHAPATPREVLEQLSRVSAALAELAASASPALTGPEIVALIAGLPVNWTAAHSFAAALIASGNLTHAAGNAVFSGSLLRVDAGTPAVFEDDVDLTAARVEFGVQTETINGIAGAQPLVLDDSTRTLVMTGNIATDIDGIGGTLWEGRELNILNMVTPFADANGVSLTLRRNSASTTPDTTRMTWNTNDLAGDLQMRRAQAVKLIYTLQHTFSQGASWVLLYASNPG
jgi:hypothetical protein